MVQTGLSTKLAFDVAGRWGQFAGRALLNVLLPPRCLACSAETDCVDGLCSDCWREMPFLEPPWCLRYGTPFSHDIGKDGLSPRAIAEPPVFDRARAVAHYAGPARDMVLALKFSRRRELAQPMGQWMARAGGELLSPDSVIVPVPLHRVRLWQRRFNQAADLARVIAASFGATYAPGVLRRKRRTRQQVGLSATARRRNVRGAFEVRSGQDGLIAGRHVVLVDDVLTTGSTVSACTRALTSAGAASVDVLIFATADPSADLS